MKNDWNDLFGEVPASFEERMRTTLASLEEKPRIRHLRLPLRGLIAAVLIVALLGATALATNLFGLKRLPGTLSPCRACRRVRSSRPTPSGWAI